MCAQAVMGTQWKKRHKKHWNISALSILYMYQAEKKDNSTMSFGQQN